MNKIALNRAPIKKRVRPGIKRIGCRFRKLDNFTYPCVCQLS